MAIGATLGGGVRPGATPVVITGSGHAQIYQVNDDATTAQGTGAKLWGPGAITDSTFHWLRVAQGTSRVMVRARVANAAGIAVTTSPIVALLGAYSPGGAVTEPAGVTDNTVQYFRLDSAGMGDTGITLTFPGSPATTNTINDLVWFYSVNPSITPYDCLGANWVGVAVMTAGAATKNPAATVTAVPIDLIVMN